MNCPYCGADVLFTTADRVYGKDCGFGMIYICSNYPKCNAYVGAHKNGGAPKGSLAKPHLRKLRKRAHGIFDPMWKNNGMTRKDAYRLMRKLLDISKAEAHIGEMREDRCELFIKKLREYLNAGKKSTAKVS